MVTLFVFCAIVGGTILICQSVLTVIGIGGGHGDFGHGDIGHGSLEAGHASDQGASLAQHVASPEGHDAGGHHGSTWLFGVISFRTLVAALTFFGLGGLITESIQQPVLIQLLGAVASGAAAMFGVHWIMKMLFQLSEDGTVRIRRAIGSEATVYLTIPPNRTGTGKIHLNVQQRLLEYPAVTANPEKLATGAKVIITAVVGSDTLEVEPLRQKVDAA